MKRKWLLVATLLLAMSVLVSACGVPKDQYTAVVGERDAAKAQLESANVELEKTKAELESTKSQLQSANAELDRAKADLQSVNSQLQSTQSSLSDATAKVSQLQQTMAKAKLLADLLATVFVPELKGQSMTQAEEMALGLVFISKVTTSGDPQLQSLFQAWVDSNFGDKQGADLFIYIFETIPKLLE
jgi:septal ring factor EnvC (AmiA/AmiB activator)